MNEANKEIIRRLLKEVPAWSDRKIARVFDCDTRFVKDTRAEMAASGELPRDIPDEANVDEDV